MHAQPPVHFDSSPPQPEPGADDSCESAYSPDEPRLNDEQQRLVSLIVSGKNVFYTGSAGSGKSTVLNAAVKALMKEGRRVQIVAPTGRAALQVNGKSTWSYMGWTPDYDKLSMEKLVSSAYRTNVLHRLRKTDVLIIDEISMVESNHLERMNVCMKAARSWTSWSARKEAPAFGGAQIVVSGDFCQLPPVKPFAHCVQCGRETEPNEFDTEFSCPSEDSHGPFHDDDKWAFKSSAWKECNFVHVHLNEIHRQSDREFITMLQKCRLGLLLTDAETRKLMNHPCNVDKATRLFPTRWEAQRFNQQKFDKMKTPVYTYNALDGFIWAPSIHQNLRTYTRQFSDGTLVALGDHRIERQVNLRAGMLVVLQVNLSLASGLCNGSQGIICGWEACDLEKLPKVRTKNDPPPGDEADGIRRLSGENASLRAQQIRLFAQTQNRGRPVLYWPRVLFHNGVKRTIHGECIVNAIGDQEPYGLLHRTQIPLAPAWAMSIHKSQGMTLDRVIVDLSRVFEQGQVYVALSRATSLQGLKVEGGPDGLSAGQGGNNDVQEFLNMHFGATMSQYGRPAAPD